MILDGSQLKDFGPVHGRNLELACIAAAQATDSGGRFIRLGNNLTDATGCRASIVWHAGLIDGGEFIEDMRRPGGEPSAQELNWIQNMRLLLNVLEVHAQAGSR